MRGGGGRLAGKIALVTGAGAGIGRATARAFAREGAAVAIVDVDGPAAETTAREVAGPGGRALALPADVADPAQARRTVRETIAGFGRLDILVNNAAVATRRAFLEISEAEWRRVLDVNLTGAFLMMQAALPQMLGQGAGVIVNVSSLAGRSMSVINGAHYSASKAALLGLTRHVAREVAGSGVRVNAVAPATVRTALLTGDLRPGELEALVGRIPMGRLGEPEEVAAAICFLASDEAGYITGATLDVNGGLLMI